MTPFTVERRRTNHCLLPHRRHTSTVRPLTTPHAWCTPCSPLMPTLPILEHLGHWRVAGTHAATRASARWLRQGSVMSRREKIGWLDRYPLLGRIRHSGPPRPGSLPCGTCHHDLWAALVVRIRPATPGNPFHFHFSFKYSKKNHANIQNS
jgi:hypothetical protein